MAWYRIAENVLDAIANAINTKTGHTAPMTPVEMVLEIQSIPTGGGDGIGELIIDQTASENVSTINIQIPSEKQNLDCYVIKLTGSLSTNDWIYPIVNSNTPSTSGPYFPSKSIYNNAFTLYAIGLNKNAYTFTTESSAASTKTPPITNILFYLYNANTVFTSGFNIKVYGVKLT